MKPDPTARQMAAHDKLVQKMGSLLAGMDPRLQGLALADLVATWLAGHMVKDNIAETERLHADLLALHTETVRKLLPENIARIHGPAPD